MVGAYTYGPNLDGAEHFINQILPRLRIRVPTVEFWLVGTGVEHLPSFVHAPPNVRFLGFVEDLSSIYAAARVIVCPIRYGGGTRVKLIEAASWGKPIVSTTLGAEGLGFRSGEEALLVDKPELFADACARLIEDDGLCETLSQNARRLAIERFDESRIVEQLINVFSAPARQPTDDPKH
jgi:glycosyltransferase involved in cell wall biosynthesis